MKVLILLAAIVWLACAVLGVAYLTRLKNTPAGQDAAFPAAFPPDSRLIVDGERPTLIVFAHPKCPYTHATLGELARLLADLDGEVSTYVVFIRPPDESDDWTQTELRSAAEAIPNVQVVIDRDNRETNIFNAYASGSTLLYDRAGRLRFHGGLTAARGHEGDNAGRRAIFEIVTSETSNTGESAIFGCPLHKKDCDGELIEAGTEESPIQ